MVFVQQKTVRVDLDNLADFNDVVKKRFRLSVGKINQYSIDLKVAENPHWAVDKHLLPVGNGDRLPRGDVVIGKIVAAGSGRGPNEIEISGEGIELQAHGGYTVSKLAKFCFVESV